MYAIPAIVAVHGVVTADQRGDATLAQLGKQGIEAFDGGLCAARGDVTAIQEGVQVDGFGTTLGGQLNHGRDVIFVAVDATFGQQPHDVHGLALAAGGIDGLAQRGILEEVTVTDLFGDAGQLLINHATGTDVDVANFGVTHLTIRQTDIHTGGGDQGVGIVGTQGVEVRSLGGSDGVELFLGAVAPTIHDDQCQWLLGGRH